MATGSKQNHKRRIDFWDTTMRDGHQSLWATRMTSQMMEPIAKTVGEVGYSVIGIGGAAVFDSCIYYLAEDPWERLAMIDRHTPGVPKACYIRSLNILGWDIFPDDAVDLTIRTLKKYGVTVINAFDALNDTRNMESTIRSTVAHGMHAVGSIVYSISPVHTDEYYITKAKELVSMGVHSVQLKDSGALLTPERTRELVPKLRAAIGEKVQLHFHTHCTSGLGTPCTIEALSLDIDVVHSAISPLANNTSNPPTEIIAREAIRLGYDVPLDLEKMEQQAAYFRKVAHEHEKPTGVGAVYDPALYRHQVPGGMMSNLRNQMAAQNLDVSFDALLEEIQQVREDLGYPIMVSPMAQFIGVQALFNVLHGERYKVVPAEVRNYALGWYGQHPAPMKPDIYDKIARGGEPITGRPADHVPPLVERARKEHGSDLTDEELILAFHYKAKTLKSWREMRSDALSYPLSESPNTVFLKELNKREDVRFVHLARGSDSITWQR